MKAQRPGLALYASSDRKVKIGMVNHYFLRSPYEYYLSTLTHINSLFADEFLQQPSVRSRYRFRYSYTRHKFRRNESQD